MSRMIDMQSLALNALRFMLSLRDRKGFSKLYACGWYDNVLVEYLTGTMTVSVLANDEELGYNTYTSLMHNSIERIELCDSRSFEGLALEFSGDGVAVLFNACRDFAENRELLVGIKLVRMNKTHGSLELSVKNNGTVFITYIITKSATGRSGIHISNLSASWNPMVTPQSRLRAT